MNNQEILAEVMMIPATELALLQRIAGIYGVALLPDGGDMKSALVAHLQTLTPGDPADPAAEAELLAWMAAPAPVPAPGLAPPALSAVHYNEELRRIVDEAEPSTDLTELQQVAAAYGLPTANRTFYGLQADIRDEIDTRGGHVHAPAPVDPIMAGWATAHPPPAEGRWTDMNGRIIGVLAVLAIAALIVAFLFYANANDTWPYDDDNGVPADDNGDGLTEAEVREIAEEVAAEAVADAGLSESEVRSIVNEAIERLGPVNGLSETEVRSLVRAELLSLLIVHLRDGQPGDSASDRRQAGTPSSPTNGACQPGDKVGTWSEGNDPHRIEVGGHGLQHLDFYPAPGVKSISYLVGNIPDPEGVPDIAHGFGSLWEWNPPGCQYDLVADETNYARARLDSGHSGLVVQWGTWQVVASVSGMDSSQAQALVELHLEAFGDRVSSTTISSAQPATAANCDSVRQSDNTRPQGGNTVWTIGGDNRSYIGNVWNPAVAGGAERKLYVAEGSSITLTGYGGSLWAFPPGCSSASQAEFSANNQLPAYQ